MTDLERLIYCDIALRYSAVALGEAGWDWNDRTKGELGRELGLLPDKTFIELENERRELIRKLVVKVMTKQKNRCAECGLPIDQREIDIEELRVVLHLLEQGRDKSVVWSTFRAAVDRLEQNCV